MSVIGTIKIAVLFTMFLLAVSFPVRWFMADASRAEAQAYVDLWYQDGSRLNLAAWQRANSLSERAVFWHSSAATWALMAEVTYWGAFLPENEQPTSYIPQVYLEQALLSYRKSLSLQPVSAYAWMASANIMARLGRRDSEYRQAIELAKAYGPNEVPVFLLMMDTVLPYWTDQSAAVKVLVSAWVKDEVERYQWAYGLDRKRLKSAMRVLADYGVAELGCPYLPQDVPVKVKLKYCTSIVASVAVTG